jgi:predicted metal-dependent hydrolase
MAGRPASGRDGSSGRRTDTVTAIATAPAIETPQVARLPGGDLPYTLRRSPRARRLRVVIHPERGVVVTLPPTTRRGWARADGHVVDFLAEREPWLRRHLGRQAAARARLLDRPSLDAGRIVPYLGVPHRVRVVAASPGIRRSRVSRVGADAGDELLVERASRDQRPTAQLLEAWFRERARAELDKAIADHAVAMGVQPARVTIRDTTSRWGSCSRKGNLSFSWRLVLAPPRALETVAVHELCHLRVFGHGPRFRALLASRIPDHADHRRWLRRHSAELHAALD